jgi:hypothetical protein
MSVKGMAMRDGNHGAAFRMRHKLAAQNAFWYILPHLCILSHLIPNALPWNDHIAATGQYSCQPEL